MASSSSDLYDSDDESQSIITAHSKEQQQNQGDEDIGQVGVDAAGLDGSHAARRRPKIAS